MLSAELGGPVRDSQAASASLHLHGVSLALALACETSEQRETAAEKQQQTSTGCFCESCPWSKQQPGPPRSECATDKCQAQGHWPCLAVTIPSDYQTTETMGPEKLKFPQESHSGKRRLQPVRGMHQATLQERPEWRLRGQGWVGDAWFVYTSVPLFKPKSRVRTPRWTWGAVTGPLCSSSQCGHVALVGPLRMGGRAWLVNIPGNVPSFTGFNSCQLMGTLSFDGGQCVRPDLGLCSAQASPPSPSLLGSPVPCPNSAPLLGASLLSSNSVPSTRSNPGPQCALCWD